MFTTTSSHNNPFVKSLGAAKAFDYNKSSVADDIAAELNGSDFVGIFDAVSSKESFTVGGQLLQNLGGGTIVGTLPPLGIFLPENVHNKNGTTAYPIFAICVY